MSEKQSSDRTGRPDDVDYSDRNVTLDAHEDRWAWRARLRRNRATHLAWRSAVGIVGGFVTVAGLVMVPAPGPGWLVVFFGLMILASEFEFAQRVLTFARRQVGKWNDWVMAQPVWVRGLVATGTLLLVWLVLWGLLVATGVPGFLPQWAADALRELPGVG
ncbi:TIGR02611 family protein [Intrasporangium sp.]|uniref:TIGR02611 family protein n=1 Tax=Intrasporangium sp. TaxID=1925024 RepID=UPI0032217C28